MLERYLLINKGEQTFVDLAYVEEVLRDEFTIGVAAQRSRIHLGRQDRVRDEFKTAIEAIRSEGPFA